MNGGSPSAPWTAESDIVAFFDEALLAGCSTEQLVERAAVYARATVGVVGEGGRQLAYDEHGHPCAARLPATATATVLATALGGRVWVDGLAEPYAGPFLTRLAVAIGIIERWGPPRADDTRNPLEVLLTGSTDAAETAHVLSALGIAPDARVRVLLCSGPEAGVADLVATVTSESPLLARAHLDSRTVVLLTARDDGGLEVPGVPVGVRAAYGRVHEAAHAELSYRNARDAFRFTLPSTNPHGPYEPFTAVWINGAALSGLAALCRLRREDIEMVPEVGILDGLAEKYGEHVLRVLEAYAATESMRRGAAQIHMHHNSVRYWVQRVETELGYSLAEPYRRAQLYVSLCLLRLWRDGEFDEPAQQDD